MIGRVVALTFWMLVFIGAISILFAPGFAISLFAGIIFIIILLIPVIALFEIFKLVFEEDRK